MSACWLNPYHPRRGQTRIRLAKNVERTDSPWSPCGQGACAPSDAEARIRVRCKLKFVVTTDSKHHLPIAPDLLQRNLTPSAPNQVWTGDIIYIATDEGWLYLAAVIDLFSC